VFVTVGVGVSVSVGVGVLVAVLVGVALFALVGVEEAGAVFVRVGVMVRVDVLVGGRVAVGVGLSNNLPTSPIQPLTLLEILLPMLLISLGKIKPRAASIISTRAAQTHLFWSIFLETGC